MHHFCTYFDARYLPRGLALFQSLMRHCPSFTLWVLCMDTESSDILSHMALPNIRLIPLADFEQHDEPLRTAKKNRSQLEYYWTCTPSLLFHILKNQPEVDRITYLDADLFFFDPLEPIYEEMAESPILIIEHRFSPEFRHFEKFGKYNVGLLSFRRDKTALRCLRWWRERCLEYCSFRLENGRFGDQQYLDEWPDRFRGVAVLRHKGAGLAPWNIANHDLRLNGGHVLVDDQPLIFYHFHGLRKIAKWVYDPGLASYRTKLSRVGRRYIYMAYIRKLHEMNRWVSRLTNELNIRGGLSERQRPRPAYWKRSRHQLTQGVKRRIDIIHGLSRGDFLFAVGR